jgi:hypothetical protein
VFTLTNNPTDGQSLTFRGATRTFKTSVSSSSTQIAIGGSVTVTANNLMTHLGSYPFDTTSHLSQIGTTNIAIIEDPNISVTASISGAWGFVTVTTTTLTQRGIAFPFSSESTTTRTNDANDLILAFNYASSAFAANVAALSNYVNVTAAQTISGLKSFTGGITNTAFIHTTNLVVGTFAYFKGGISISNFNPTLSFFDTSAVADKGRSSFIVDEDGLNLWFYNDALSAASNVFSIDRNATYGSLEAIFRTRLKADYIYDTPLSNVTFLTAIAPTINGGTQSGITITNANAGVNGLWVNGQMSLTNGYIGVTNGAGDFEILRARSTYASSTVDQRTIQIAMAYNGGLAFNLLTDAGAVSSQLMQLGGSGAGGYGATFPTTTLFGGLAEYLNNIQVNGFLLSGADGFTNTIAAPTGASYGLYLYGPASDLAANPTGAFLWNNSGLKYRTDTASEGTGGTYYLHNRQSEVQGAGTDYTLTASTAAVDFGTTDPQFTAPTAGTYFIWADVAVTAGGTANDDYRAKLRDTTTATDLTGNDQSITYLGVSQVGSMKLICTATLAASDVVALYAHNNTAARGTVNSARTRIGYVRLY